MKMRLRRTPLVPATADPPRIERRPTAAPLTLRPFRTKLGQLDAENRSLYANFALSYDSVFGFGTGDSGLNDPDVKWLTSLVRRRRLHAVLDVACGTGKDVIPLRRKLPRSVALVGCDDSSAMVRQCFENSQRFAVAAVAHEEDPDSCEALPRDGKLHLYNADWFDLGRVFRPSSFDLLFCTNYTFAHCVTKRRMIAALRQYSRVLKPGGWCYIDSLKFEMAYDKRRRPVSCREVNEAQRTYRGTQVLANGARRHFLTVSDYYEYPLAIRSILQKKAILLLEEEAGRVRHYEEFHGWLAPFDPEDFLPLLAQSGLVSVARRNVSSRRFGILARKPLVGRTA